MDYLKQINQILADPNVANVSTPSILANLPPFSPEPYVIWVNTLWFLSLAIALTGAMVATLGQEWVHRYSKIVRQSQFNPDKGARVRTIFASYAPGSCTYHIWGTGRLSLYLHLSFFLFVAGVLISLFNNNHAAFYVISSWFAIFMIGYALTTVEAIFKPGSLFYTPLSPLVFRLYLYISYAVLQVGSYIPPLHRLCSAAALHYRDLRINYHNGFLRGKWDAVVKAASTRSSEVDAVVLEWTLDHLGEDNALETFFKATPGFFKSRTDDHHDHDLPAVVQTKFENALDGFLDRTFSYNSIPEVVRSRRLVICLNATQAALGRDAVGRMLLENRRPEALTLAEGHDLRAGATDLRRIIARIISRVPVPERDQRWVALVKDEFGIPDHVLPDDIAPGDGASLAVLISITRQLLRPDFPSWGSDILQGLSNFDIRNTLPGQQDDFCALWDEVVQEAQERGRGSTPVLILREIRHLYIALHQGADAPQTAHPYPSADASDILLEPSSYQFCRVADHRPDSTSHLDG